ncbi:hypothetical protein QTH87_20520 [Variovorax sp. J22P168]|uniref:hypothetical protein n=1 Tax=Variovorax jilinensis TaxID=3053513 RepID=UPI0025758F5D|nr:hypothetical protein [Variovorax sp. J22P168]MDM0014840.1 hypothetical protein [Variovorax sp. J22P168]
MKAFTFSTIPDLVVEQGSAARLAEGLGLVTADQNAADATEKGERLPGLAWRLGGGRGCAAAPARPRH